MPLKLKPPFAVAEFSDPDFTEVTEFQFSGTAAVAQDDGLIRKGILRTGHWPVTPTAAGKVPKPLTIIKDGQSDYDAGIIALSDVVDTFGADGHLVQIPLAGEGQKDHANQTRNNTGFVRKVWIEDRPEWGAGQAELMAAMDFTDADAKVKVLEGTYADVSSGVPWVETSEGQSAFLDHVCITNKPFIKHMTGWLFSDDDKVEVGVATLEPPKPKPEEDKPAPEVGIFFFGERLKQVNDALKAMNLHGFTATDISESKAIVKNDAVDKSWFVTYAVVDGAVLLATSDRWEPYEKGAEETTPPNDDLPSVEELESETNPPEADVQMSALERAQKERELLLSRSNATGGPTMGKKILSLLDGVELTDEQRRALEAADERAEADRRKAREGDAQSRIGELKGLGIEMPGALKLYRKVFLSDDGGPAAVLFSDDGKEQREVKAIEILDLFIDACKGAEGKVQFSDQAIDTGSHTPPPKNSDGENKPLEDRVAESRDFLKLNS
jgi:hypothetical protein